MDDRGRLAQSVSAISPRRLRPAGRASAPAIVVEGRAPPRPRFHIAQKLDRWSCRLEARLPRGVGLCAAALVIAASLAYGVVKGGHAPAVIVAMKDARDCLGNVAGFRIVSIALSGHHHVTREEVLAIARITGSTSLLFLDVDEARERLRTNPWIADAAVLKLYPGALQIGIRERAAFALWQRAGHVSVIADDGTVLEPYVAPGLIRLPLVVGSGAQARAKEILALLDRHPGLRDFVRASVLVGERRWNLRLENGIDVLLPESNAAGALEKLAVLDREKRLTTRDIVAIDLRLPDRVTVRLSDAAAQARIDALKPRPKKQGDDA
jgi:cell division protein FtsQ